MRGRGKGWVPDQPFPVLEGGASLWIPTDVVPLLMAYRGRLPLFPIAGGAQSKMVTNRQGAFGYRADGEGVEVEPVQNFRGTGNTRTITDLVTTSGSTTVTSATALFTSNDVGAQIQIKKAGNGGGANQDLWTTIASVTNATTAVLTTQAAASNAGGTTATITFDILPGQACIYDTTSTNATLGGVRFSTATLDTKFVGIAITRVFAADALGNPGAGLIAVMGIIDIPASGTIPDAITGAYVNDVGSTQNDILVTSTIPAGAGGSPNTGGPGFLATNNSATIGTIAGQAISASAGGVGNGRVSMIVEKQ